MPCLWYEALLGPLGQRAGQEVQQEEEVLRRKRRERRDCFNADGEAALQAEGDDARRGIDDGAGDDASAAGDGDRHRGLERHREGPQLHKVSKKIKKMKRIQQQQQEHQQQLGAMKLQLSRAAVTNKEYKGNISNRNKVHIKTI